MKTLLIGGSGFIGTRLVESLQEAGHQVRILDRSPTSRFGELATQGDVRDLQTVRAAMEGVEAVFLLAAEHRDDVQPSSLYYDVNVAGAENTAQAAADAGIRRIIFTSTVAVYGLNSGMANEDTPTAPFNDYGHSKLAAEEVLKGWARGSADRSAVIVRPTVVFGEDNRGNVFNLLSQVASGKFVMVGNGENRKSMCYVGNLVPFLIGGLTAGPGVRITNYADKPDLTMNELVSLVRGETRGDPSLPPKIPYSLGLMGGYAADVAARLLGRSLPISSVRVRKFCATTQVAMTGPGSDENRPPYSIQEGLIRMIRSLPTP